MYNPRHSYISLLTFAAHITNKITTIVNTKSFLGPLRNKMNGSKPEVKKPKIV